MPVQVCELNGQPGFRWGQQGRCYTYEEGDEDGRRAARRKAARQGRAIEASRHAARKNSRRRRGQD